MVDFSKGYTELLLQKCRQNGLLRNQTAYVLATAWHETGGTMEPVREAYGKSTEDTIQRLDTAWKRGQLKWVKKPYWRDGWFGRGFVQLTHKENYQRAGDTLGVDLVSDPDKAMDPVIAADIIVHGMRDGWFTGKRLADYVTINTSAFTTARKIVNGTDRAELIASHARKYDRWLLSRGYGVDGIVPEGVNEPPEEYEAVVRDADKPALQSKTNWLTVLLGSIGTAVTAISGLHWGAQIALVAVIAAGGGYLLYERSRKAKLARQAKAAM